MHFNKRGVLMGQKENIPPMSFNQKKTLKKSKASKKQFKGQLIEDDVHFMLSEVVADSLREQCQDEGFRGLDLDEQFRYFFLKNNYFQIEISRLEGLVEFYEQKLFQYFLMFSQINQLSEPTLLLSIFIMLKHFSCKDIDPRSIDKVVVLTYILIASKYNEVKSFDLNQNIASLIVHE